MVILGASGHGKVIADIVIKQNLYKIECFLDDVDKGNTFYGFPVFNRKKYNKEIKELFIAIGNNKTRKKIANQILAFYPILIHPSAIISQSVIINEGSCVMANSTINADTQIGKHCIINTSSSIDHDCTIGDFSHISPNASLAGNVKIGEASHVGIGASIIQNVTIGKNTIIGAGSVIINDIPDNAVVVGVPGKIIKKNSYE